MAQRYALKDRFRELRLFHNRVAVALIVTTLCLGGVGARLIYLQIIGHEKFSMLSQENRVNILPVPPTRGLIYDRNGMLLAQNRPAFSLELVPEHVKDLDDMVAQLSQILPISEDDIARFHKLRKQKPIFESIPLRLNLTHEEVAQFAVVRHRFPGADIVARPVRHYPLAALGSHVIGYVGRINEDEVKDLDPSNYAGTSYIGKSGVEKAYETTLHGHVGVQQMEVNALGRSLRMLHEEYPEPGKNVLLSIDAQLQHVAETALQGFRGALVAIEPKTGDVLALVSVPTYDPNPFVVGIDVAAYQALQSDVDQPLFNRALRGQYPPGSTIKPFVGLAGLESNKITASSQNFCPGWYSVGEGQHRYRDWRRGGHGSIGLRQAIAQSCDVYFYDLALTLGIDTMATYLAQFGFGQRTGIDVAGEEAALLPTREWKRRRYNQPWYPGETVIAGIGQGYWMTTPLQLATATATLANHGVRMRPRTVRALQNPDTLAVTPLPPVVEATIKFSDPSHWNDVVAGMLDVVHSERGTAKVISKGLLYSIASKTGTAQVFSVAQDEKYDATKIDERLRDHALYVAFAPAENPQIAVAVMVENAGHGGSAAAPIARQVMDYYLLAAPRN